MPFGTQRMREREQHDADRREQREQMFASISSANAAVGKMPRGEAQRAARRAVRKLRQSLMATFKCIDCGVKPRPKRELYDDRDPPVSVLRDNPDAALHHRCHACHGRWKDRREADYASAAKSHILDACANTPSRKTVTARKRHQCAACNGGTAPNTRYDAFTIPGPRTVKLCNGCASGIDKASPTPASAGQGAPE